MLHPRCLANYGFHSALPTVFWKRSLRRASLPRRRGRSKGLCLIARLERVPVYNTHTVLLTPQKKGIGPCEMPVTFLRQA
jgi:hypothetical protein